MAGFNPNTWPTFQQSMPITQGAMTGEQLLRAHLQNQMQKQQNQVQPGLDAAKLSQMQASTQGQQISNEQSPEMLALKEYAAKVAAKNAEHGRQNIGLQYDKLPALFANAAYRASNIPGVMSAEGEEGDPTGIMGNILSGAAGFSDKFAQVSGQPSSAGYNQPSPQQQMALQQALQQAQQNRPQEQAMPAPNFPTLQKYLQGQAQQPQQPGGQPGQPIQPQQMPPQQPQQQQQPRISPDVLARAQDATRSSQIKRNTTAQILNQQQFANNLRVIGDPIEIMLPKSKKYFGIGGKAALLKDTALASGKNGITTPELKEYQNLTDKFTVYANEYGRTLALPATDKQKQAMKDLINPEWLMSNPNLALARFQGLRDSEKRIDAQLAQSTAQKQESLAKAGSEIDQQPQAQSSSISPPVGSAAPAGTVGMYDKNGDHYWVKEDQADDAVQSHGWSRANG